MFVFILSPGSGSDISFIRTGFDHGDVYTYPSEEEARSYFSCVSHHASLYQIDDDLSTARLILEGDVGEMYETLELDDEQKVDLWNSYRYKSLLSWTPEPEDIIL